MSSTRFEEARDYAFADQALALRERAGLTQRVNHFATHASSISVRCLHRTASLEDSVDEGVERNQLSILHPAYVDAFDESGSAGRSILPGNTSNAEVFLNRRGNPKDGARKPVLHSRDSGAELFGSVMDAFGIDEDPVLVPQIGNGCLPLVEICLIEDPMHVFRQQRGEIPFHGLVLLLALQQLRGAPLDCRDVPLDAHPFDVLFGLLHILLTVRARALRLRELLLCP